jgi:hypothetical protein
VPITSCPHCGEQLVPVDTTGRPDTPPWLSPSCARGWWNAELTPAARKTWDPRLHCTIDAPTVGLAARAERDGQRAQSKGK